MQVYIYFPRVVILMSKIIPKSDVKTSKYKSLGDLSDNLWHVHSAIDMECFSGDIGS